MTLWSGRLPSPPSDALWSYTVDRADTRLLPYDIQGSIAHIDMLHAVGLLTDDDHAKMQGGLGTLLEAALAGTFDLDETDEDIHSAVERRLVELIGEPAYRLHTGRSRNDQVALGLRLYLRDACLAQEQRLAEFALAIAARAEEHADTVVAGYTHMQQAQPIQLGHHLLAHAWPAIRDRTRFADLRRRLDESPLGAGALAGTSLPIDPTLTAAALGFSTTSANSIDAVGARDLAAEFVWCCTQAMVSRSRLAEELVLWAGSEFGWATFPDGLSTGSSALPHKKNPDIAELARGRSASAMGDLTAILALQRSLPLAYNRDLQEDKVHVFRSDDTLAATLSALARVVESMDLHPPAPGPWVGSLDLVETLVLRGVPHRHAHDAVGKLTAALVADGKTLADATPGDLAAVSDLFEDGDLDRVGTMPERQAPGASSPKSVHRQITALRSVLGAAE